MRRNEQNSGDVAGLEFRSGISHNPCAIGKSCLEIFSVVPLELTNPQVCDLGDFREPHTKAEMGPGLTSPVERFKCSQGGNFQLSVTSFVSVWELFSTPLASAAGAVPGLQLSHCCAHEKLQYNLLQVLNYLMIKCC